MLPDLPGIMSNDDRAYLSEIMNYLDDKVEKGEFYFVETLFNFENEADWHSYVCSLASKLDLSLSEVKDGYSYIDTGWEVTEHFCFHFARWEEHGDDGLVHEKDWWWFVSLDKAILFKLTYDCEGIYG